MIGAPFVLSGFAAVQGRMDALAYWVISDHFEELGRPPRAVPQRIRPAHASATCASRATGRCTSPPTWATTCWPATLDGDGADVLVQAWATRHDDGTVDVLVWNGTVNAALMDGDPRLDRRSTITHDRPGAAARTPSLARVDEHHSNVVG